MNIGFLSDLHIDNASKHQSIDASLKSIINVLKTQPIDVLVLSGDISSDWRTSLHVIDTIQSATGIIVYCTPGNHDFWLRDKNTAEAHNAFIEHPSMLMNEFIPLTDDWCLYGGLGWYDYSFHTDESTPELAKRLKSKFWVDAQYVDWKMDDDLFFDLQLHQWEDHFTSVSSKNVIFSQHFVPYKEFLTYKANNPNWNFCSAYIGSARIGEFIDNHPEIKISSFGHTHKRFGSQTINHTEFICNPVGYPFEWESNDYEKEIMSCLTIKSI